MYVSWCMCVHALTVLFESLAVRDQQPCMHWKDSFKSNCMWHMSSHIQSCTTDSRVLHALLLCLYSWGGWGGRGGAGYTYIIMYLDCEES